MQIIQTQKEDETIMKLDITNWPFAFINGQRTEESQKLLNTKRFPKQKEDFSDCEEALL